MITTILIMGEIIVLSVFGFLILYLVVLSFCAMFRKDKISAIQPEKYRRFAVVIPAYNEESTLDTTIDHLQNIDYPAHLYDIIVIADNCSDQTEQVARSRGVTVYPRRNPEKVGKGYALRWCFDKITSDDSGLDYDSVIVIDADSLVLPNILQVMNKWREKGAQVIQGYMAIKPKPGIWTNETIRIGFTLYNYVRSLGRKVLGLSGGLRGNGMCFTLDTLQKVHWNAYSLTEDLEYGLDLLLNGINVVFAPEVIGYNIIPERAENAESQRERWELGRFPLIRKYAPRLLSESIRNKSFKYFDALVDLLMPPLVNMMLIVILGIVVNLFLWWVGVLNTLSLFWIWGALLALTFFHVILGLFAAHSDGLLYRALKYVPRYALWKLMIYLRVLFKGRTKKWIRTTRENLF